MKSNDFNSMSSDELWVFYEQVYATLVRSIAAERARIGERLRKIELVSDAVAAYRRGRPYPKVLPLYRNPKNPAQTWSGRGRQPHWVRAQLRSGKRLDDLRIRIAQAPR